MNLLPLFSFRKRACKGSKSTGSRTQKKIRQQPSFRPRLEWLEDRLMPSASASTLPVSGETPLQLVSAMNQWNLAFVTLENKMSSIEQAERQEIAQLLAYVHYQVDQLFHIDTNTSSSTPNAAVPQTGNSSGSGNGSSNLHTGPIIGQNGEGSTTVSGSGSTSRTKPRDAVNTSVQPLTASVSDPDGTVNSSGSSISYQYGPIGLKGTLSGSTSGTFSVSYNANGTLSSGGGLYTNGGTFTLSSGTVSTSYSGNTESGTFTFSGTNSEDDTLNGSGSFRGTISDPGPPPIYSGTYTCSFNAAEPPPNNDTLVWNPKNGNNASTEQNWLDQTQKNKQGVEAPTANNTVIFDGSVSNAPITWDQSFKFSEMMLGPPVGGGAYTGKQTINSNVKVELTGGGGTSLSTNILPRHVRFSQIRGGDILD